MVLLMVTKMKMIICVVVVDDILLFSFCLISFCFPFVNHSQLSY